MEVAGAAEVVFMAAAGEEVGTAGDGVGEVEAGAGAGDAGIVAGVGVVGRCGLGLVQLPSSAPGLIHGGVGAHRGDGVHRKLHGAGLPRHNRRGDISNRTPGVSNKVRRNCCRRDGVRPHRKTRARDARAGIPGTRDLIGAEMRIDWSNTDRGLQVGIFDTSSSQLLHPSPRAYARSAVMAGVGDYCRATEH